MSRLQEADSKLISKTGRGLLDQAIQNDYHEIVKVILFDLNLSITHEMLVKAIKAGSPKVVKMFLAKEKSLILEESFQATDRKEMMMHQLEKKYSEDVEVIENLLENVDQNDWENNRNRKELIALLKKQLISLQESKLGEQHPIYKLELNPRLNSEEPHSKCTKAEMLGTIKEHLNVEKEKDLIMCLQNLDNREKILGLLEKSLLEKFLEIEKVLQLRRKKDCNERKERTELVNLLTEDDEQIPVWSFEKKDNIYTFQIDCKLSSDQVLLHCTKLQLQKPLISWLGQRFDNLTTGFLWTCENNYAKLTEYLLRESEIRRIKVNAKDENGNTGFHLAYINGHHEIVEILLKESEGNKIDFNAKNKDGDTVFHIACRNGDLETIEVLLEETGAKKIDFNAINDYGTTGFFLACSNGHHEIVEVLLKEAIAKNVDVNARNRNEETGFHTVCRNGDLETIEVLLKETGAKNIDINAINNFGATGFYLACSNGHHETVRVLLEEAESKDIDLNKRTKLRYSGFDIARRNENNATVEILLKEADAKGIVVDY